MKQARHWGSYWVILVAVASSSLAVGNAGAATPCFKVYDGKGTLTYEGRQAPVDIRNEDSASWAQLRLRSEHLIWFTSENCRARRQQPATSAVDGDAEVRSNADLILNRIPSFGGR